MRTTPLINGLCYNRTSLIWRWRAITLIPIWPCWQRRERMWPACAPFLSKGQTIKPNAVMSFWPRSTLPRLVLSAVTPTNSPNDLTNTRLCRDHFLRIAAIRPNAALVEVGLKAPDTF